MPLNPTFLTGLKIGLLGGSFNPAHQGHRLISLMAMQQLHLDQVWWLVSPQNPLKSQSETAPLQDRLDGARHIARHPRIIVQDLETRLGTQFTYDTLTALKARARETRFVWLMGADNAIQFPRWHRWREITEIFPIAVYPRPGFNLKARSSKLADIYRPLTLDASDAPLLPHLAAPALCFLSGPQTAISSTEIRETEPASRA